MGADNPSDTLWKSIMVLGNFLSIDHVPIEALFFKEDVQLPCLINRGYPGLFVEIKSWELLVNSC